MKIIQQVENFLYDFKISDKTVICAVSGGVDSVVLFNILNSLKKDFNLKIVVAHLNHNWRGKESKRDEDFVRDLALKNSAEFYFEILSENVRKTELDAREARYDFFERAAKKFETDVVFLAHNKNDNAETLLYRIAKGTALKGLCAIPKQRDIFYRPLIEVPRNEIETYAKEQKNKFVKDSSNDDVKYKRNLIRNEILPLLEKINPDTICALNNLSKISNMQFEIVKNAVDEAKQRVFLEDKIKVDEFLKLSEPLQFEIVNNFLQGDLKNRDFKRIKMYVDFIKCASSKISVNKELFLENKNGFVFKSKPYLSNIYQEEITVQNVGEFDFLGKKILIEEVEGVQDFNPEDGSKFLDIDFKNLTLRTRREGDVFCPFGSKTSQKLKDYLIKKKISRQERDNLILLAQGSEILCIMGIEISQKVAVKNCKKCYKIGILGV